MDPGLARCGWAELDLVGRVVRCGCLRTRAAASEVGDEQRRLVEVTRGLRDIVANASRVVIEWPSSGGFGRGPDKGNAKSASQTGKVAAMVYGLAVAYGRPCTLPAPVTWRTALGARRGADGELHAVIAVRHEEALVGVRAADLPHVLDAIGLAEYRLQLGTNNSERRR